ncbi:MAG TPA: GTP cyclohydrolase II [Firmicutes bacterium]|nr:GTP cyclohydrolase II [Bacillota bacterium]
MFRFPSKKNRELPQITLFADARLPTPYGEFHVHVFRNDRDNKEHLALTMGDVGGERGILVRVHSECLTGETLGSLRCDCREQLESSMKMISQAGRGILIYLRQEGRGIGLGNKIRAYALQDKGLDTIEANHQLGFAADERDYHLAVSILKFFDVKSLLLLTNNPEKIRDLSEHGIEIIQRVPLEVEPNEYSRGYLKTKRDKAGHLLEHLEDFEGKVIDLPLNREFDGKREKE